MQTYEDLISKFIFENFPALPVKGSIKFEAIVSEIIGSKQRRFGPLPSPEIQVAVRDYVRDNETLHFFLPWGASKQDDGATIDIAELMALKQLLCLKESLARYNREAVFHFRIETLTDRYLFGPSRFRQIRDYAAAFQSLAKDILGCQTQPIMEGQLATSMEFNERADFYAPVFYNYLKGSVGIDRLVDIGWTGTIPQEQQDYYYHSYKIFYPNKDHQWELARYFAATLARVKLKATAAPSVPHIVIAFTHPVPGSPVSKARLHYRAIPEKYTNHHRSPWLSQACFEIGEDNSCTPKFVNPGDRLCPNVIDINGIKVNATYRLA